MVFKCYLIANSTVLFVCLHFAGLIVSFNYLIAVLGNEFIEILRPCSVDDAVEHGNIIF